MGTPGLNRKVEAEVKVKKRISVFTPLPMPIPVFFITGGSNVVASVQMLLDSGIRCFQYRIKNRAKKEMFYEALELRELTKKYKACLIVNDYADLALAVDADGLHLGQEDLPLAEARKLMGDRLIGISTHNLSEAAGAEKGGADYIGFGPVFHTTTKDAGGPKGLDVLEEIRKSVKIPVLAIGGIKAENVRSVLETGCYGVAVSSGLLEGDIRANGRKFLHNIRG